MDGEPLPGAETGGPASHVTSRMLGDWEPHCWPRVTTRLWSRAHASHAGSRDISWGVAHVFNNPISRGNRPSETYTDFLPGGGRGRQTRHPGLRLHFEGLRSG